MAKKGPDSATRRERAAAARRAQEARARRRRVAIILASCLAVVVLLAGITAAVVANRQQVTPLTGVQTVKIATADHVSTSVKYPQSPPAGGNHHPVWLNCGVYDKPVPNENAVHDLEHGAVWITYRPDLPTDQVQQLRDKVGKQTYLVLSPFPNLPAPVVASAWGVQLRLTGAADERLDAFITKYRQGSQAPEPGAPCDGGTGTPL